MRGSRRLGSCCEGIRWRFGGVWRRCNREACETRCLCAKERRIAQHARAKSALLRMAGLQLTSAAKACRDIETLIAALKRCATQMRGVARDRCVTQEGCANHERCAIQRR